MRLKGTVGTSIKERPDGVGGKKVVTAEDHAEAELRTANDLPIMVHVTNVDPAGKGLTIRLTGERGILTLDSVTPAYGSGLRIWKDEELLFADEVASAETDARIPPFQQLATRLLTAIRERETTFHPSFEEGHSTQAIRCAVLKSFGTWIDFIS